jgi:hypothetical protein
MASYDVAALVSHQAALRYEAGQISIIKPGSSWAAVGIEADVDNVYTLGLARRM